MYLARVRALSGDITEARANATRATAELESLGEEVGRGVAVGSQAAEVEALAGNWQQAERLLRVALASVREHPTQRSWEAYFLARLGEAALAQGDAAAAAALVREARAATVGDTETEIWWRRVAARAHAVTGRQREALRLARQAMRLADGTDDLLAQAGARLDLAEVLVHADREAEAAVLVEEGVARLDRKGATLPAANARARFADLLERQGEGGAAIAAPRGSGS
jgi:tetratricopeptide (TPR) repeat protein